MFTGCEPSGSITVNSTPPGAWVCFTGGYEDTTPCTFPRVDPGFYTVYVRLDCSEWYDTVTVMRGSRRTLNATLGVRKWHVALGAAGEEVRMPAVADDGTIYVVSGSNLYAVDPAGNKKWSVRCVGGVCTWASAPAVADDGSVYVVAADSMRSFRPDGRRRWGVRTGAGNENMPAIGPDGTVYVSYYGSLLAVKPDSGVRWRDTSNLTGRWGPPAVGPDGVVYCSGSYGIRAIYPNGTLKWQIIESGMGGFAFGPDSCFYTVVGGALYAFRPEGSLLWRDQLGSNEVYGCAALGTDGTIYAAHSSGIAAVTPGGVTLWKTVPLCTYNWLALTSDNLLYGDYASGIACYTTGGVRFWAMTRLSNWPTQGLAVGPDGTIYVTTADGELHAIEGSAPLAASSWPTYQHDSRHTGRER